VRAIVSVVPLLVAAGALVAAGCLGTGTRRLDAPCREMSAALAQEMLRDNPAIAFLDVRAEATASEPIAGARRLPYETLVANLGSLQPLAAATLIVIGADRAEGERACELLARSGFSHVVFVRDGAELWLSHQRRVRPAGAR